LFKDQALTVTFALIASLVLAFTLIPMLSALGGRPRFEPEPVTLQPTILSRLFLPLRYLFTEAPRYLLIGAIKALGLVVSICTAILKPVLDGFDLGYERLANAYAGLLLRALHFRLVTISLALLTLMGSIALLPLLALELIPPLSQGEFKVDLELSAGTRLELTDRIINEIQTPLGNMKSVEKTYSIAGTGGRLDASSVSGGENVGELNVSLRNGTTSEGEGEVMDLARSILEDIPDARYKLERPQLFTFSTPLEVQVFGSNLEEIREVAERLSEAMAGSNTFRDVESSMQSGYPEIQIEFDQDRIASLGLTVPDVANGIVRKVKGEVPTEFTLRDKKIDIRLRVAEEHRNSVEDIENIVVNPEAERQIRLSSVARIFPGIGPADVQRIGQQRVAIVSANVPDGDLGAAAEETRELLAAIPHPTGVKSIVGGQNEE
ncbi:MAG: efflux RND transporter permease subunit, partial [Pseudomonadales bacterium]